MPKTCKSEKKPAAAGKPAKAPKATECESCGLDYCDCEICDEKVTIQVPPSK